MYILSRPQFDLLLKIMNDWRLFDKRDNTFLVSNRKIASRLSLGSSTVDRLMRVLKKNDLLREVLSTSYTKEGLLNKSKVLMLSPKFLFISYTKTDRWLLGGLWELRDISLVYKWRRTCSDLCCYIDPITGEMLDFNWYLIERKANQYTSFDRCHRTSSKDIYHSNDVEIDSQYYSLRELDCTELSVADYDWITDINKDSNFVYNKELDFNTKTINSVYDVRLKNVRQEME